MFANLTNKFQTIFRKIKNRGKLSEDDIKNCLHEIRIALLEADVNYKVVKEFINDLYIQIQQEKVSESLTPAQQIIKIVNKEITKVLGSEQNNITMNSKAPTIILLAGLQGTGKTTTAVKLGHYLRGKGHKPLLVATDIQRPAATEQLKILGVKSNLPVFSMGKKESAINIIKGAIKYSKKNDIDVLIIDTAGRLHIDDKLMNELQEIEKDISPQEKLLIVDAMAGQDALNAAKIFCDRINISGVILTKLDGDSRGGVALSLRKALGVPIKFIGIGEKIDNLQVFHPERMASRILGMGDILTLIEKTESAYNKKELKNLDKKIRSNDFDLSDFYFQLKKMKNIGSMEQIVDMIPGFNNIKNRLQFNNLANEEDELKKYEAIISSMTIEERKNPYIINGSRRKRIARGSGTQINEINRLLKQFFKLKGILKKGPTLKNIPLIN
ncbi:signal recognition particle protein [candidate division TA06 bacterium]|uniref:Signal recognition particle protein n=1 Tax=candidate division TA06 bacterium TaxID=2250710 RepID=A0A660SF42_UNCT6|nr:MAG: signal recognition particle protein [candidate division TA06 bacterium]